MSPIDVTCRSLSQSITEEMSHLQSCRRPKCVFRDTVPIRDMVQKEEMSPIDFYKRLLS